MPKSKKIAAAAEKSAPAIADQPKKAKKVESTEKALARSQSKATAKAAALAAEAKKRAEARALVAKKPQAPSDFTFIDLFAGIGGIRRGFEAAGGRCVFTSEWNPHAQKTYLANFDDGHEIAGDITKVDAKDIPDHDVLVGGFPCFVAGALVQTMAGMRPIEELRIGDMVLTHQGRYRRVNAAMSKNGAPTLSLRLEGSRPIRTTAEHPFWARRAGAEGVDEPSWVEAKDLGPEWLVGMPRDKLDARATLGFSKERLNPTFWRRVGRLLRGSRRSLPTLVFHAPKALQLALWDGWSSAAEAEGQERCGGLHLALGMARVARNVFGRDPGSAKLGHVDGSGDGWANGVRATGADDGDDGFWRLGAVGAGMPGYFDEGFFWSRVSSCALDGGVEPVFNIGVEEDESYVVEGALVHNCQPFSIAGVSKKASMGRSHGFEDKTQGTLFFDVARIIKEKRPKAFMLENVKNLLSHDKGQTFKVIKETLEKELGYKVEHRVVDSSCFVPQKRERILIVGFREDAGFSFDDLTLPDAGPKLQSILHPQDGTEAAGSPFVSGSLGTILPKYTVTDGLWAYLQAYAAKHRAAGNGFGFGMVDGGSVTRTLSARYYKDGSEILVSQGPGKNPRRLTPRECARLMGFPESQEIVVSDTQAYKQFGNSVVVPVMAAVAKLMRPGILKLVAKEKEENEASAAALSVPAAKDPAES